MQKLLDMNGKLCRCGKVHSFSSQVVSGKGVLSRLPELAARFSAHRIFVLSDPNTYDVAGRQVCALLAQHGFPVVSCCLPDNCPEPDETSVGSALMHYDSRCDLVIGVGSGVINDIGKLISTTANVPYIIVATAPSMDGYASATSSMTRSGLKISLSTKAADVILGDTEILRTAPLTMMKAGLGDMLAKYVSICEWRLSHRITGEYYCEEIADLIRCALKRCIDNADGLLKRDENGVQAVFEGLVIGGVAMNYAGLSRPASGVEHYISHILDMRAVEFKTPAHPHGIQCAVGTMEALKLYEALITLTPDRDTALSYVSAFDKAAWEAELRVLLGKGAEIMIALEKTEGKYDPEAHRRRLEIILAHWQEILDIIAQELPASQDLSNLLTRMDMPQTVEDLGIPRGQFPEIFRATKDIRDKYVLSRLAWDLGVLDRLLETAK